VTIAIPVWQQRISPLLDTAARLLVLTCRDGREASRREIVLEAQPVAMLARTITALRLDLLLCGAASKPLLVALKKQGVRVRPHLCGEIEAILRAFCHGQLDRKQFRIPGCKTPTSKRGTLRPPLAQRNRNASPKRIQRKSGVKFAKPNLS
jgi:hypothetical protein